MNELQTQKVQLPDTIEDLTQFVLVSKAKLQAYMLKLQTVNKLSVAQEIRDQTLQEAQEVSSALIAAEQRIGELLLAIPKAQGKRTDKETSAERTEEVKTKAEIITEQGYERHEAADYQQMAKHPEVVQKVLDDALANGTVVTKSQVMREIKASKDEAERLKRILSEKEAENVRLKNQKVEVKEVVKTVEIVPDDYEELKERVEISRRDYASLNKAYENMAEKWRQSEAEKDALINKMNSPEEEVRRSLKNDCVAFCMGVRRFLERNDSLNYLKDKLNDLSDGDRKAYVSAVYEIRKWADERLNEITV